MIAVARRYLRDLGGEPAVVLLGGSALLIVAHHQGSTKFFRAHFGDHFAGSPGAGALPYLYWFAASLLLYLAAPLALSAVTGGSFHRRYGLGLGHWRPGVAMVALFMVVMVPAVLVASSWASFKGQYPLAGARAYTLGGELSLGLFGVYLLGYFLYFVGWEFLFRGWMLNALLPRFGKAGAVLIPTAPFVVMHLGKPQLEALGSIVAGVALGILALRTRSFWYGAFLHGSIAVLMDVASAWPYLFRP